jgi:hypothetical protein
MDQVEARNFAERWESAEGRATYMTEAAAAASGLAS